MVDGLFVGAKLQGARSDWKQNRNLTTSIPAFKALTGGRSHS